MSLMFAQSAEPYRINPSQLIQAIALPLGAHHDKRYKSRA
jgi:hypothetical protein